MVGGKHKKRLTIILYVLLVILKTAHANRRSFTVPALAFVYSRGKVSIPTTGISIVTCDMVLTVHFFSRLILAQHCAFVSSLNRELKQRHSTHVNRKRDLFLC